MTSGPATTSVSLLARADLFAGGHRRPGCRASPALPTMAVTTTSTSGRVTARSMASGPRSTSMLAGSDQVRRAAATHRWQRSRPAEIRELAVRASRDWHSADNPTAENRPWPAATTSSVLRPMLPVDPNTATRVGAGVIRGTMVEKTNSEPQRTHLKRSVVARFANRKQSPLPTSAVATRLIRVTGNVPNTQVVSRKQTTSARGQ